MHSSSDENEKNEQEEFFNAILASSVHDMKNALGILINTIDEVSGLLSSKDGEIFEKITFLEMQSTRLNTLLMQLLSIYKIDRNQYPFQPMDVMLNEFLEEQSLRYAPLMQHKNITMNLDCDELFSWVLDQDLIAGVINDSIGNAVRYAKGRIAIRAKQEGDLLRLSVEDDGPGFPESVLEQGHEGPKGISFHSGSTGLGLFFCSLVARLHRNNGKVGFVEIDNNSQYGGGRFSLLIP